MLHKYLEIATTPAVRRARERHGGAARYAAVDGTDGTDGPTVNDRIGPAEAAFIAARDGFYIASVSETGWPYVQYRGGPPGFLRVLDPGTLGFADFRGNRQQITTGNVGGNDRVSLFLMDYANRRRLKLFGRVSVTDAADAPDVLARLQDAGYRARVERVVLVRVAGFDWNCPQHITPRFTDAELAPMLAPLHGRIAALEAEQALRDAHPDRSQ